MANKSYDFLMNIVSKRKITLSNLERTILEKLKDSDIQISEMDINTFAKEFFISNSSITRFAQKLGFNGFTELKYSMHSEDQNSNYVSQNVYLDIINHIEPLPQDLVDYIQSFNTLDKIVIIGIGSSGLVANEFVYKMGELGLNNVDYAKEPYKIDILARSLSKNDMMICLSLSGENDNILKGARVAHEMGATILSISGEDNPTIKKYSHYFLKTPPYSTHEYKISKIIPVLVYVDIICEIYSKKDS